MSNLYLNIAGFNIKLIFGKTGTISYRHKFQEEILEFNKGFITTDKPKKINFYIEFIQKNEIILREKEGNVSIHLYKLISGKKIITYYHISRTQFSLLLRHILDYLLGKDGIIFHCSASLINEKAVVFVGERGAGKSTAVTLLSITYPILADDVGILKKEDNIFCFYQTPILEKGKNFQKKSIGYPFDRILFLRKSNFFKLVKIDKTDEIFTRISSQTWTEKQEYLKKKLKFLFQLTEKFRSYYFLYFSKEKNGLIKLLSS